MTVDITYTFKNKTVMSTETRESTKDKVQSNNVCACTRARVCAKFIIYMCMYVRM